MMSRRQSFTTSKGFQANVVTALQVAKNELEMTNEKANFIRIIMRFPKIKSVLDRLRAIYVRCDKDSDGEVDLDDLYDAMTELFNEGRGDGTDGRRGSIEKRVLQRTFSSSPTLEDDERSTSIEVNQFIVMVVVGFILAEEDKDLSTFGGVLASGDDAMRGALTDVVTAYLSFDKTAKGYFTSDEFTEFMTTSTRAEEAKLFFTDERFNAMDKSTDGKVTFEAFVYALSKWVSDDEDDDDEDDTTNRVKNPLTPRITLALQLSKSILDKQKKEVNFTRIIMRFPKIHNVFDRIIKIHDKFDLNKDGRVQLPELTDAMRELMANSEDEAQDSDFTKQVENIFMLSDLDHHGLQEGLDIKEFIVFCAVGFILAEAGGKSVKLLTGQVSDVDMEYRNAMMDIVGAYLTFDTDGKGYFTSDEMHAAKSDGGSKDAGNLLTPDRWKELDIDRTGRIDFEEFVHAFSTWVTAGDNDDE